MYGRRGCTAGREVRMGTRLRSPQVSHRGEAPTWRSPLRTVGPVRSKGVHRILVRRDVTSNGVDERGGGPQRAPSTCDGRSSTHDDRIGLAAQHHDWPRAGGASVAIAPVIGDQVAEDGDGGTGKVRQLRVHDACRASLLDARLADAVPGGEWPDTVWPIRSARSRFRTKQERARFTSHGEEPGPTRRVDARRCALKDASSMPGAGLPSQLVLHDVLTDRSAGSRAPFRESRPGGSFGISELLPQRQPPRPPRRVLSGARSRSE